MKIANGPMQSGNDSVRKICNCTNFGACWLILIPTSYFKRIESRGACFYWPCIPRQGYYV
jgi:hypothetical protein